MEKVIDWPDQVGSGGDAGGVYQGNCLSVVTMLHMPNQDGMLLLVLVVILGH